MSNQGQQVKVNGLVAVPTLEIKEVREGYFGSLLTLLGACARELVDKRRVCLVVTCRGDVIKAEIGDDVVLILTSTEGGVQYSSKNESGVALIRSDPNAHRFLMGVMGRALGLDL